MNATHVRRVAVITGASQGIGAGLVDRLPQARLRASSRPRAPSRASDDPGGPHRAGDIADRATAERVVDAARERFGRIDTLVNNAGIFIAKPFTDYTDEDYDAVTGVNLRRLLPTSPSAPSPRCSQQGGGHIVSITTSLVDHANSQRALRARLADQGRPERPPPSRWPSSTPPAASGSTPSSLGHHQDPDAPGRDPRGPRRRCTRSAGWARSATSSTRCVYLENAPFVTGEILHVDGGQSAGH